MDRITSEELQNINKVWHRLVGSLQRTSESLWAGPLSGVTTVEMSVLSLVEENPDIILREILSRLSIPASTLTSAVDRLEKRGLLQRVISRRDRRSFGLLLTDEGRQAQQEHRRGEEQLWEIVMGSFDTAGERAALLRLLGKLTHHLDEAYEEALKHE